MRVLLVFFISFIFLFVPIFGANSDEGMPEGNPLRANPDVEIYRADEKGVARYVEGNLGQNVKSGDEVSTAIQFFTENKAAFRMENPSEELKLQRIDEDQLGMRHVRFDQIYRGLKVIGGAMIVHYTADGKLKTVNGKYEPEIELGTTSDLAPEEAVRIASDDLAGFFGSGEPSEPELVVFPWEDVNYLAWRFFIYSEKPMGRWEYFVDANTGEVIFKANRIMDANDVGTGVGVMGDTLYHIDTHLDGSTYYMYDYTRRLNNNPHGHDGQMPDDNYIQTNVAGSTLPGSVATDSDNFWDGTTYSPAVSGHVYTGLVYDYLLHTLGRNGYNDNGATMLTIVNYSGDGDNNAYWDGSRIVIWSWASGWRSLAGCPDVIAHEWGHAVTEYTSGLVYQKEPGALNEAFSDMIGAAFEFAHDTLDVPDWEMGENGRLTGEGFRSLSDPHLYGDPDTYGTSDPYWIDVEGCTPSWYNDYCGVHTNSGVGNKWFFLLSDGGSHNGVTVTGIGVQNAMQIAYHANAYYWTTSTDYHQAALATLSAANDLDGTGAWAIQVSRAWNAVNVETPGPYLTFDYPNGIPSVIAPDQPTTFEVVINGQLGGEPAPGSGRIHYSIDGGTWVREFMTPVTASRYNAVLPAVPCDSRVEFYVSAEDISTVVFYDPDTLNPNEAIVATSTIELFSDNFETDQGWVVSGNALDGQWTRGVPVGGGDRGDPANDYDASGSCYLTDNVDDNSDVDDGTTILTSPTFDMSQGDGIVHYARWYSNDFGADPNNDVFRVYLSNDNGSTWTIVDSAGPTEQASGGWYAVDIFASEFLTPSAYMKIKFEASDLGSGSVVEAGVDDVTVTTYLCASNEPVVATESIPDWTVDMPMSVQLEATGGTGNYTWTDKNDDLSGTGLSLSTDGVVSGSPVLASNVTFIAVATDDNQNSGEKLFSFNINDHVAVMTTDLPEWTVNEEYAQNLTYSGGTDPVTWSDKNGDLDGTGLILQNDGYLFGTPAAEGTIAFTAMAEDAAGDSDETPLTITINPAVAILTDTLPDGYIDEVYSQQLEMEGGTGDITWVDKNGDLGTTGLELSSSGLLFGTVTSEMTVDFTARVSDLTGSFDEKQYSFAFTVAYICGDLNDDEAINLIDITFLVEHLYGDGPAPEPMESADVNSTGTVDILDISYLIGYLYKEGPAPNCQ